MRRRSLIGAVLAAGALAAAGCGAPDELDSDDDRRLLTARERLDDAIDTEEAIRTSRVVAGDLRREVRRAIARDDVEALELSLPWAVEDGSIDREATSTFLRLATTDPQGALLPPARESVEEIVDVIEDSGADAETKVPGAGDRPLDAYLDGVERDIRDIWPSLSKQIEEAI
jgi:hypothetical protein